MRHQATLYVRWEKGGLELEPSTQTLIIRAKNYEIMLEPRSILISGKYSGKREIEHMNRKTIFIDFAEKVEPLNPPRIDISARNYVGNFEVIYTDLGFEHYLTIITPAEHLYDYAVLTTEEFMVYMQAKRQVFYEEEPFEKIILYIK